MFEYYYTLTEDDVVAFNLFQRSRSNVQKKVIKAAKILLIVLFALLFALIVFLSDIVWYTVFCGIVLALAIVYVLVFYEKRIAKVVERSIRKQLNEGKPAYGDKVRLVFNEDYFTSETDNAQSKMKYNCIDNVAVSNVGIYIYLDSIRAICIPTHVFKTDDEQQNFIDFINSKITK